MKTRLALALAVVAGAAAVANAQQVNGTVSYTLNWHNSATLGQDPLNPGQSAVFSITATINPAPGSTVGVNGIAGSAATQLTLRGLQQMFLDLVGTNNAAGTWSGQMTDETWDLVGPGGWGTSANSGANLLNVQAGQFPTNQTAVMTTNPIVAIWTGTWTPDSYAQRTVNWATANGTANPEPFASKVVLREGTVNPGALVLVGSIGNGFGSANVPVIPAPSSLALLGLGGLLAARRRR